VGNKSDLSLERRPVSTEEGDRWAQEEGLLFVEASAKSGDNVEAAFEKAARDILIKIRRGVFDDDRSPGVKSSNPAGAITLDQRKATGQTCCGS
jgi:Ras-related protein Rab-2A